MKNTNKKQRKDHTKELFTHACIAVVGAYLLFAGIVTLIEWLV